MKKMSEVFELPVKGFELEYLMSETTGDDDELIAHAVNHVDALADALEALIKAVECNELLNSDFNGAVSTLKAYRGEK